MPFHLSVDTVVWAGGGMGLSYKYAHVRGLYIYVYMPRWRRSSGEGGATQQKQSTMLTRQGLRVPRLKRAKLFSLGSREGGQQATAH